MKKSETKKETNKQKTKAGGQPGHQGKTRKSFERVDRIEILKASECNRCGQKLDGVEAVKIETQQVAQLVVKPIEIIEYQRHHIRCACCSQATIADWSSESMNYYALLTFLIAVLFALEKDGFSLAYMANYS